MSAPNYTLAPSKVTKDELQLITPKLTPDGYETRASALASAVGGRYARELSCYFLTPARARKWELLYLAGWWPAKKPGWYTHPHLPKQVFELPEAVTIAKLLIASRKSSKAA